DPRERSGAGTGHQDVLQGRLPVRHGAQLLEGNGPGAVLEAALEDLARDVSGIAGGRITRREHGAAAGPFQCTGPGLGQVEAAGCPGQVLAGAEVDGEGGGDRGHGDSVPAPRSEGEGQTLGADGPDQIGEPGGHESSFSVAGPPNWSTVSP